MFLILQPRCIEDLETSKLYHQGRNMPRLDDLPNDVAVDALDYHLTSALEGHIYHLLRPDHCIDQST
jgi:hypothetical protein